MDTLINNQILYHGSASYITSPKTTASKDSCDFGPGFYTTRYLSQAVDWGCSRIESDSLTEHFVVTKFAFKKDETLKCFEFKNNDIEWFKAILRGRQGRIFPDYDIVIGPVADSNICALVDEIEKKLDAQMRRLSEYSSPADFWRARNQQPTGQDPGYESENSSYPC